MFVLFAASPCPFALVKHLEHGRRQITASDTGVPVRFSSPSGPPGCISCVPLTWELSQMGACPVGPGCCPEQGGLLSLSGLSPGAPSPELIMHPHPATLTSRPLRPGGPSAPASPLVAGTGQSSIRVFPDPPPRPGKRRLVLFELSRCKSRQRSETTAEYEKFPGNTR